MTQSAAQVLEIIDLAVEDDGDRLILVIDRLVAAGEVDDGKPAMAEPDAA
jgi:hypothetical protein